MNQIYAIDSTRVSHREYWWGAKSPLVLIGWIIKWLRIRLPRSADDPNFESATPCVIEALPPDMMARLQPLGSELAALGFNDIAYHCFQDAGSQTTIYWATFLHGSGAHYARIHYRRWGQAQKQECALFPMFFTEFTDGTFAVSSSGKPDLSAPDTVQMNRLHKAPTAKLWEAHQQFAAKIGAQKTPVHIASAEEVLASTERHHVLVRDYHLARGVFRPRTAEENAKANAGAASMAQAQASGFQYPEVMAELERLQEDKPRWGKMLWLLPVSILVFVLLGAKQWDWKFTLWLIPVLLLHEGGHWVAMRIFRYRNMRMFFIPLFGAAVIGRHWNVAGWKKAIVSLAGPLPGIILGCALAIVAFIVKKPWVNELALILLLLNGFNLLPVLPLDGGHVLHVTLFCRNRWLDFIFRCLAVVGLLLLSVAGGGKGLLFVAIGFGIGLPIAFKQGKVVDKMRQATLPPPPLDSDRIPAETAYAIINELKAEQPKGVSNKILAQQTLAVFETLNAKPPNALATIGLLALHAGAFFFSALFLLVMLMGKIGGGFGNLVDTAARQPQHVADTRQPVLTWRGADAASNGVRNLIVATFDHHAEVGNVYSNFTRRLPGTARMTQFGDSLLVSLPVNDDLRREEFFNLLQGHTTNTFVVVSNHPVSLSLFFLAPNSNEASNMVQELLSSSAVGNANLIPPWSPTAKSPEYTNYLAARRNWLRLNRESYQGWDAPAVTGLNKKISAANRRGATAEAERLSAQRDRLLKELQAKRVQELRAEMEGTSSGDLVDLYLKLDELSYTNRAERKAVLREVAAKLGEVRPPVDDATFVNPLGAQVGSARSAGLIVEVPWARFNDPQVALPQVMDWLIEHKCAGVKYDFHEDFYYEGLEEFDEGDK